MLEERGVNISPNKRAASLLDFLMSLLFSPPRLATSTPKSAPYHNTYICNPQEHTSTENTRYAIQKIPITGGSSTRILEFLSLSALCVACVIFVSTFFMVTGYE